MKNVVLLAFVSSLLLLVAVSELPTPVVANPPEIVVPDDYEKIQWAIGNASDGDTIFVKAGTYHEHVVIDKTLTLIGENKNTTVISGLGYEKLYGESPFWGLVSIAASNVVVSGFTIRDFGIGVFTRYSSHCNITGNMIANHEYGIDLRHSENNFIGNNTISGCNVYGITISENSRNNILRNNNLTGNRWNLGISSYYFHDIDTSNIVDGKPVYYWVNQKDKQIPSDAGYVALVNSTNIVVKNLMITHSLGVLLSYATYSTMENVSVSNSGVGIHLYHSHNNTITGCALTKSAAGIRMDSSSGNRIAENTISHNWDDGIAFYSSNENLIVRNTITVDQRYSNSFAMLESADNLIYHNNIIHRYNGKVFLPNHSLLNQWDNGLEGNYWSDYNGTDANGDGIGDTAYLIDENKDRYPLMSLLTEAPDSVPPIADARENRSVAENTSVEFDGSKSYDNVAITSYEWDFGDGTTGMGMTIGHTYVQIGNYTVTLTVKDGKHNSDSTSIIIEVLIDTDGDAIADKFDTDDDGDSMPDEWEIENGLDPLDSSDKYQDPDGDWFSNIEEYRWGMNPRIYNPWKIYFTTAVVAMVIAISLTVIVAFSLYRKKRERQKDE